MSDFLLDDSAVVDFLTLETGVMTQEEAELTLAAKYFSLKIPFFLGNGNVFFRRINLTAAISNSDLGFLDPDSNQTCSPETISK